MLRPPKLFQTSRWDTPAPAGTRPHTALFEKAVPSPLKGYHCVYSVTLIYVADSEGKIHLSLLKLVTLARPEWLSCLTVVPCTEWLLVQFLVRVAV